MKKNKCVICEKNFNGFGHNPDPIKAKGRCCNSCNSIYVIPLRLAIFRVEGGDPPKP